MSPTDPGVPFFLIPKFPQKPGFWSRKAQLVAKFMYISLGEKWSVKTGNYYSIHKPKKGNEEVASMEWIEVKKLRENKT